MILIAMNHDSKIEALIPAAGIGERASFPSPKQYLTIGNKTVIEHTLAPFITHRYVNNITVVINSHDNKFITLPISKHPKINIVIGGNQRVDSVIKGLDTINADWVIIHDAARPCLHIKDLTSLIATINFCKVGSIIAVPVDNTIKRISLTRNVTSTVKRDELWYALTPQLFPVKLLRNCLHKILEEKLPVTDESSALEYFNYYPMIIHGRRDNIKITWPEDLQLAACILSHLYD